MATAAPNQALPLFYSALEPLNTTQHANFRIRGLNQAPQFGTAHAIPATVEEFALLQRHYPIVFSVGENPVPLGPGSRVRRGLTPRNLSGFFNPLNRR